MLKCPLSSDTEGEGLRSAYHRSGTLIFDGVTAYRKHWCLFSKCILKQVNTGLYWCPAGVWHRILYSND